MIAILFHFFCHHIEDSVCIFLFLNKAVNLPCKPVTAQLFVWNTIEKSQLAHLYLPCLSVPLFYFAIYSSIHVNSRSYLSLQQIM